MADINVNSAETVGSLRANKLDTFNDFYSRMLEQQKAAEALYKLSGLDQNLADQYEQKYRGNYSSQGVPNANPGVRR